MALSSRAPIAADSREIGGLLSAMLLTAGLVLCYRAWSRTGEGGVATGPAH